MARSWNNPADSVSTWATLAVDIYHDTNTYEDANGPYKHGTMFSTDCSTWLSLSSYSYGSKAIDNFIFNFDPQGKVVSVEPFEAG